jgi:hypothetical protein
MFEQYCQRTGATKTGSLEMFLLLKNEQLLAIVRKSLTVN